MKRLAALLVALPLAAFAAAFPPYASLPRLPIANDSVEVESYGQMEFITREKPQVARGKTWLGYLVYPPHWSEDPKHALAEIVRPMQAGGWEVMYRDDPRNPPLATLKREKDGRVSWASVEIFEHARVAILEVGTPSVKLQLDPPAAGIEKVGASADFPFLKRFPGAKLTATRAETTPLTVALDPGKEPVQVASGSVSKEYTAPAGTGKLEVVTVYRDAMKAAGWIIVEEDFAITTGDPNFTARYARGPVDLWTYVRAPGNEYTVAVADAGAERSTVRLKAQLERECRVAVYGVQFDFDKAAPRRDAEPALAAIRKLLAEHADLRVELGGHTDNVGGRDHNLKLSDARVNAVRGWLVGKGIDAGRISARGYGDTQPVASNESVEGRAKNRRVELKNLDCRK